ncbi:MAG: hypothetical protein KKA55_05180 [Proteobacteria bacterium]|nr:hypothetical protein [Pseudomonadota bacterium]MBU1594912.1 hypothetical protein [Pseudomonadota bacterium]
MGRRRRGRTAFILVLKGGQIRVRKPLAPVARPMADARRRQPRRRPDLLLDE